MKRGGAVAIRACHIHVGVLACLIRTLVLYHYTACNITKQRRIASLHEVNNVEQRHNFVETILTLSLNLRYAIPTRKVVVDIFQSQHLFLSHEVGYAIRLLGCVTCNCGEVVLVNPYSSYFSSSSSSSDAVSLRRSAIIMALRTFLQLP